jgi:ABC-type antimicrobial peptide transport system permease subunit
VNEKFARYFYGDADPLGRRFTFRRDDTLVTIVGVVSNGKSMSLREDPDRFVYYPYTQSKDLGSVTFYVRAQTAPEALAAAVRDAAERVDAALPLTDLRTMNRQIQESLFAERMVAALSVSFGGVATLLAAVGLYGLLSYTVAMRTRELGIRLALGAERKRLLALVSREVALLVLVGVAIGLPVGLLFGRFLESELYGLSAGDPLIVGFAVLTLLSTAALAGAIPAARASRVDPMIALRYE